MPKLVIISPNPDLRVGQVYRGLTQGPFCEPRPDQYIRVVAPSDAQSWIDCLVEIRGEKERTWLETLTAINGPWYYYEIQTD